MSTQNVPDHSTFCRCGHMCCCMTCSSHVTNCPLCRRRIDQAVRTFRHWLHYVMQNPAHTTPLWTLQVPAAVTVSLPISQTAIRSSCSPEFSLQTELQVIHELIVHSWHSASYWSCLYSAILYRMFLCNALFLTALLLATWMLVFTVGSMDSTQRKVLCYFTL
jgi:hypothetical protein